MQGGTRVIMSVELLTAGRRRGRNRRPADRPWITLESQFMASTKWVPVHGEPDDVLGQIHTDTSNLVHDFPLLRVAQHQPSSHISIFHQTRGGDHTNFTIV